MAGLRPDHIHVAEIYDSFTITVLIALEDLGFCPKGEGGAFVASGAIRLGGRLPVNTHGGQLSYSAGHGQYIVEAVRQLRQVAGARYALSQGTAALCSASFTLILAS
jgi:acetyl-CoA acetyltransferase